MGNSHRIIIALVTLLLIALIGFIALDRYQPSESLRELQLQQQKPQNDTKPEKVESAQVEPKEEKTPIQIEEPIQTTQSPVELSSSAISLPELNEVAKGAPEAADNRTKEVGVSELMAVETADEKLWLAFQSEFAKKYANSEEAGKRREIFNANLRFINEFNERNDSFSLAINQFADLSREEINRFFVGPQIEWAHTLERLQVPPQMLILSDQLANSTSIDWRNSTNEAVNQANFLDSAVFAVLANIEVALTVQRRAKDPQAPPVKLSLNHLLDCLSVARLPVCRGELSMVQVFQFLQDRSIRLASELTYEQLRPKALAQTCLLADTDDPTLAPPISAHVIVHQSNLLDALINSGPLSATVDASQSTFHFYSTGMYHDPLCSPLSYNQHLLIVARSTSNDGRGQLIARNSFGPKWGESGHIRLLEDERNKCLPQNLAVYPNLAS